MLRGAVLLVSKGGLNNALERAGSHGHGAIVSAVLGSVVQQVLAHAPVPVYIAVPVSR